MGHLSLLLQKISMPYFHEKKRNICWLFNLFFNYFQAFPVIKVSFSSYFCSNLHVLCSKSWFLCPETTEKQKLQWKHVTLYQIREFFCRFVVYEAWWHVMIVICLFTHDYKIKILETFGDNTFRYLQRWRIDYLSLMN